MANPWAYRVDYASEIAKDESEIAALTSDLAVAVAAIVGALGVRPPTILWLVAWDEVGYEDRLRALGLTREQVAEWFFEEEDRPAWVVPEGYRPAPGWSARVDALEAKFRFVGIMSEEQRRAALRRVKARLAKHRRMLAA